MRALVIRIYLNKTKGCDTNLLKVGMMSMLMDSKHNGYLGHFLITQPKLIQTQIIPSIKQTQLNDKPNNNYKSNLIWAELVSFPLFSLFHPLTQTLINSGYCWHIYLKTLGFDPRKIGNLWEQQWTPLAI